MLSTFKGIAAEAAPTGEAAQTNGMRRTPALVASWRLDT